MKRILGDSVTTQNIAVALFWSRPRLAVLRARKTFAPAFESHPSKNSKGPMACIEPNCFSAGGGTRTHTGV